MFAIIHSMLYTTVGILAHVDAGKTTLSEALMYNLGKIKALGRVDKGDTFLDTDHLEKVRGITIFSKQALLDFGEIKATLLDTPGHVDFSSEAERTLSVLDCAILVINGSSGIQSHTRTIWKLLRLYNIPTFIFVNKMDMVTADKNKVFAELSKDLSSSCIDFSSFMKSDCIDDALLEDIATLDENLMERFLSGDSISLDDIKNLIYSCRLYPVFFGSALKNEGIDHFINSLQSLFIDYSALTDTEISADSSFSGRVYKITRDSKEERLTHIKLTSGTLSVREMLGDEKITGIRIYDGSRFESVDTVYPGQIAVLTGLKNTYEGQGLGSNTEDTALFLTPVISYEVRIENAINEQDAISKLMKLSEEQPDLSIDFDAETKSLSISLMGEIQTEVIKTRVKERFGFDISFSDKRIIYKETIDNVVEGVGHFEPLRHYAEVHLLMEPLDEGAGLVFETNVSEDLLDKNWQRLIMTHLKERNHRGVLTGSVITDIKITLVNGRAHIKHTEGGDFRQATYRAVRNGLMQASSHLLEPYYSFVLTVPSEYVGRAMTDLEMLYAKDFTPEINGDYAVLSGSAPVSTLSSYGSEVSSYTKGLGSLMLSVKGYGKCHNEEEVIAARGYDPERDIRNSADSVFCSHGSGIIVPWNEVKAHMHLPSYLTPTKELTDEQIRQRAKIAAPVSSDISEFISVEEVDNILKNAGSNNAKPNFIPHKGINHKPTVNNKSAEDIAKSIAKINRPKEILPEYLLVDGYNVIYASQELCKLANDNIDAARTALIDILCDYQSMKGVNVIAVFDAYRLMNHPEEYVTYNNIDIVYTKTAQTADYYIMRFTKENRKKYRIRVATSDYVEQVIVRGENTTVVSSREFLKEYEDLRNNFIDLHKIKSTD